MKWQIMLNIASLFGKSPFAPLQSHMKKVALCVERLSDIFNALVQNGHGKDRKARRRSFADGT